MAISLFDDQVRFLRLRAQRLIPQLVNNATCTTYVVKELCGIEAQDAHAATLAVRVRSVGLVAATIEQERV